jgi:hypothetical protein
MRFTISPATSAGVYSFKNNTESAGSARAIGVK